MNAKFTNIDEISKEELINKYKNLEKEYQETQDKLKKNTYDLTERIKELNCLYQISELSRQNNADLDYVFQKVVDLLPPAWQYPGLTCGRITFGKRSWETSNFIETPWKLSSRIIKNGKSAGSVDVFYLKKMPDEDNGPFLNFEQKLIKAISERLSRMAEREESFSRVRELENFNAKIISNVQEGIFVCDRELRYIVWNKFMEEISGLSSAEVIGKKADEIFPHVIEGNAIEYMQGALRGEIHSSKDAYYDIPHSGKKGWYTGSYSPHISSSGDIIGVIGTIKEISKYKESEENLRDSRENLRAFASHLQTIREEERTMIAREIHDDLGQALTALKINLSLLMPQIESGKKDEVIAEINEMQNLIDGTIKRMRKLITELRPEVLDKLGLIDAIEYHGREFCRQTGLKCSMKINIDNIELEDSKALAVFRIFQESLTNAARHSNADKVLITIDQKSGGFVLKVRDNGTGIDRGLIEGEKSFGIIGMRERAAVCSGDFSISSDKENGTTVMVSIPF